MTTIRDSHGDERYSVPAEAQRVFLAEILQNPLMKDLPAEIHDAAASIKFVGSDDPSIAINWRFAESIASLKAFEGAMLSVLLQRKYGVKAPEIVIDTYVARNNSPPYHPLPFPSHIPMLCVSKPERTQLITYAVITVSSLLCPR